MYAPHVALSIATLSLISGCGRAERADAGDSADAPPLTAQTTTRDGRTLLTVTVSSANPEDLLVVSLDARTASERAARPSVPGETELSGITIVRAVGSDRKMSLSWLADEARDYLGDNTLLADIRLVKRLDVATMMGRLDVRGGLRTTDVMTVTAEQCTTVFQLICPTDELAYLEDIFAGHERLQVGADDAVRLGVFVLETDTRAEITQAVSP